MRVWAAGCTVWLIVSAVVVLLGEQRLGRTGALAISVVTIVLIVAATVAFNWQGKGVFAARTDDEYLRALEESGKLEARTYRATRAFQVEEWEDEGSHYFVELEDGSVLYLTGQYLYDFEPHGSERRFPCTEFAVRTNLNDGSTIDLVCAGTVLEPEVVAPPFARVDYRHGRVPARDREILTGKSYDEWMAERVASA